MRMVPIESNRPAKIGMIDLEQDGMPYVKDALGQGGPLAALVAKLFEGHGTSFAALEEGTTLERAKQFTTGTFMATAAIRKWLAGYMEAQWGADTQLIVGDPWMKSADTRHFERWKPYFFGNDTAYYVPQGKDLYARLTQGQKCPVTWLFAVFVISPPVLLPQPGQYATQEQLNQLAQNTKAVLASAYDHEGYVVWQK